MRRPFDHFNLVAGWYDRMAGRAGPDSPFAQLLSAEPGQWLLDVGGGTGRNSEAMVTAGVRVVICDRAPEMVRVAAAKGLPAMLNSVEHLPFASDSVERMLVVDAFHHFTIPRGAQMQVQAAEEMLRVLKPGGRILVHEPDIRRWPVRLIALAELVLLMRSRFMAPPEMVDLFGQAGARVVAVQEGVATASILLSKD